jgi:ribosomal 50S subunit-associated protein YjgA (DUF615 family)
VGELWLPADWVADIAGISPPRYAQWAKSGILRQAGYGRCTEAHAFEAAVASRLRVDIKSVLVLRIAMDALRPALINPSPFPDLVDIIWDKTRKVASWASTEREIALAVRHGREVRVVPMRDRLEEVRDEFRRQARQRLGDSEGPRLRVVDGGN